MNPRMWLPRLGQKLVGEHGLLGHAELGAYEILYENWGANPSTTNGLSVTPGASDAEGTYASIATGSNISEDVVGIYVVVHTGFTSATAKSHLLDIGIDPAGGTSYTTLISNIVCGQTGGPANQPNTGAQFFFPIRIPSGSQVAVRIQGSAATAGTVRVMMRFYKRATRGLMPVGTYSETIGTITGTQGVTFTPGNLADGSWTSLGSSTKKLWWLQPCVQLSDASVTATVSLYTELAYGDGTTFHTINKSQWLVRVEEAADPLTLNHLMWHEAYRPVKAGTTFYIRGRCSAAPDSPWNAVVVGVG